jgi:hypothetical protein
MNVRIISAVMGMMLIVAGIAQIFYQMHILADLESIQHLQPSFGVPNQLADIPKLSFQTTYPGIVMIGLGVLLLGLDNFRRGKSN